MSKNIELFQLIDKDDLRGIKKLLETKNKNYINDLNQKKYIEYSYPLIMACNKNKFEIARYLVDRGANVHDADFDFITVTLWTIMRGNLEFLKYLHTKGVDLNHQGYYATPLGQACYGNNREMMEYLISNGANINLKTLCRGDTPLMDCIESKVCDYNTVKYLLDNGADPNILDNSGHSAIHFANKKHREDIILLLKEYGADDDRVVEKPYKLELKTGEFNALDLL